MNSKGKRIAKCNQFSLIWAAIYGCTGAGEYIGTQPGNFSTRINSYACPVCQEQRNLDKSSPRDRQARMAAAKERAGVVEYRNAGAAWVNGRPVVTSPGYKTNDDY